jgi:hypothetical protein
MASWRIKINLTGRPSAHLHRNAAARMATRALLTAGRLGRSDAAPYGRHRPTSLSESTRPQVRHEHCFLQSETAHHGCRQDQGEISLETLLTTGPNCSEAAHPAPWKAGRANDPNFCQILAKSTAVTFSSMTDTKTRVPRTHARPWQMAGFTLIRSRQFVHSSQIQPPPLLSASWRLDGGPGWRFLLA